MFLTFLLLIFISPLTSVNSHLAQNDSPQWRNQKQSGLLTPPGDYIELQADGFDTLSLQKAVLSTNETGTWTNQTTAAPFWVQTTVHGFDNFGTATYKDGVLYAPSKGDDKLYAVNSTNGNLIWNTTVRQCDGSPCIDGEVLYVGECEGPYGEPTPFPRAMALNRTTGAEIWHFTEPNNFTWVGSPVVNNGYVYYTTYGAGVYALNKTDGTVLWHQDVGLIVCSIAYDNGMAFVSVYDPPVQYAFNGTTGQVIWSRMHGRSWDTSPVIYNGMLIQVVYDVTSSLWSTYVLNEKDGGLVRMFEGKGSTGTPLVDGGRVYIPANDWTIWAYDLSTGNELWQTVPLHNGTLQNYMYCSPASAGGAIYCQSLNGTFYVLNETDGGVLWSYPLSGYGFGSPSIGDGCVFITNDGALYAFNIGPGIGDWPMFCHDNFHTSVSQHGVEYIRWPLTQPQYLGGTANTWVTAKFVWCNSTVSYLETVAWKIYFFDNNGNTNVTATRTFLVIIPGDVNLDRIVDIYDAIMLAIAFKSNPGSPNWNSNADINRDGTVDIYDAIILANNFGRQV